MSSAECGGAVERGVARRNAGQAVVRKAGSVPHNTRTSWFDGFAVNRFVCSGFCYADERGVKRITGVLNQY